MSRCLWTLPKQRILRFHPRTKDCWTSAGLTKPGGRRQGLQCNQTEASWNQSYFRDGECADIEGRTDAEEYVKRADMDVITVPMTQDPHLGSSSCGVTSLIMDLMEYQTIRGQVMLATQKEQHQCLS